MNNKPNLKRKRCIIPVILIILLAPIGVSLGKYKKTIDLAPINLTILPKLETYTISAADNILEKQSLIGDNVTATLDNTGAARIVGSGTLTPEGLFTEDTSTTTGAWFYYYFTQEDGYSSSFDTSHIYYARCENKIISFDEGYFNFGFMNLRHFVNNKVTDYGIPVNRAMNAEVGDAYKILSVWGFPKTHTDRVVGEITYPSDYMDALQIGTANGTVLTSYTKNLLILDLTAIFGAENEPSQSWCDENINFDTETITWYAEKEQARINGISDTLITSTDTQSVSTMSLEEDIEDDTAIEYSGDNFDETINSDENIVTNNNVNETTSNEINSNEINSNEVTENLETDTNSDVTTDLNSLNEINNNELETQ